MKTEDEICKKLKNEIDNCQTKYILLIRLYSAVEKIDQEMPAFLQSPKGQAVFSDEVKRLISEQI
ncbi:MAG: hypothetical protein GX660_27385, partial [Clostridiaceae bacterium]|nr:hypothetical protein [Clostridiaceae bacterium]